MAKQKVLFIKTDESYYYDFRDEPTMSVQDLIDYLEYQPKDAKVYLRRDNGYSYGGVFESTFKESY